MLGELDGQQIEKVLHAEVIGRIGCHVDRRTYIVPITYAYDGTSIYGHSASGLKVQMMRTNPVTAWGPMAYPRRPSRARTGAIVAEPPGGKRWCTAYA